MPTGSVDGEAYLEGLIESLSTLPAEMRRNLELMKDMDGSCSAVMEETMRLQQVYLQQVEEKMGRLEVVNGEGVRVLSGENRAEDGSEVQDDSDHEMTDKDEELPIVIPTVSFSMLLLHHVPKVNVMSFGRDHLNRCRDRLLAFYLSPVFFESIPWKKLNRLLNRYLIRHYRLFPL